MLSTLCNEDVVEMVVVLYYLWNNNKKNICACSRDEKYLMLLFDVVPGVKSRVLYTLGKTSISSSFPYYFWFRLVGSYSYRVKHIIYIRSLVVWPKEIWEMYALYLRPRIFVLLSRKVSYISLSMPHFFLPYTRWPSSSS